jgi:hypothetical protein
VSDDLREFLQSLATILVGIAVICHALWGRHRD